MKSLFLNLKKINSIFLWIISYVTFFFIDLDLNKIKEIKMIAYLFEHWNYLVAATIISLTFKWIQWTFKKEQEERFEKMQNNFLSEKGQLIQKSLDNHGYSFPLVANTYKLMKNVVLPHIGEKELSEHLDKNVFGTPRQFVIPELEKYGVDAYQIALLRKKYYEDELKKQNDIINEHNKDKIINEK